MTADQSERISFELIQTKYKDRPFPSYYDLLKGSMYAFLSEYTRLMGEEGVTENDILNYWDKWACNYVKLKKEHPMELYLPTEDTGASPLAALTQDWLGEVKASGIGPVEDTEEDGPDLLDDTLFEKFRDEQENTQEPPKAP